MGTTEAGALSKQPQELEPLIRVDNIEKSQQDTRDYRGLKLKNGLKVLLISDPETDVSAAALSVQVGHMSDPIMLPGLAHFCEHMLFLGTEKYPNENDYTTYLSQHSGGSNAVTFSLATKYHFHVTPDQLGGALDRFSQFFIAPLFTPSATEREINAVNSEHEKNLSSDIWRTQQVHRNLAKPDHPYHKFGSGNKETLYTIPQSMNIDVRDELLKFHKEWYSANIMQLAVFGKENLDELESLVMEKFAVIENKNIELPTWPPQPFSDDKYGQKLFIIPIKDVRSMTISFTTEDLCPYYKSSPEGYLSHLLGHEGKGSLLSELRRMGWCNDLIVGHSNNARGFGFFDIVVDFTVDGLEHVDDIIKTIFQYMNLLRKEGPQKRIFDECVNINKMRFRFKDKERPEMLVKNAVAAMQIYPLQEVNTAPFLSTEWRPDLITNLLDEMVPSKCRISLVSQAFEEFATETEPYYKTKYGTKKFDPKTLKEWENCGLNEHLALPEPNAFIPENFDLLPFDADISKHPVPILDTPILRVWHKQDDVFLKPKSCMSFDLSNPIAHFDPMTCCMNQLMVMLLKDQLNEYLYDADLAGLKLDISSKVSGIEFVLRGYSDKKTVLLQKLLVHLFNFTADEKRYEILREEYIRSLKNFKADQPYQHAIYYLSLILTEDVWGNGEILEAMKLITYNRVMQYGREFFQRLHVECFIYGNVNKQRALDVASMINNYLEDTDSMIAPLLARQMMRRREYKLASGDSYLFEKENEYHKSNCVQMYLQCGPQSDRLNTMISLIAQILSEPCYDALRTKEQLGYIVLSGVRKVNSANGIRIIVQSTHDPNYVEDRIECFLDNFLNILEEMSIEEFERHRESLALKKLEKPKTIFKQFVHFHTEIHLAQYHFEREEVEVGILRSITKDEVIDYFKNSVARNAPERRVVGVHIKSALNTDDKTKEAIAETKDTAANENRHNKITDLVTFKNSKELYPLVLPVLDIRVKGARSKL